MFELLGDCCVVGLTGPLQNDDVPTSPKERVPLLRLVRAIVGDVGTSCVADRADTTFAVRASSCPKLFDHLRTESSMCINTNNLADAIDQQIRRALGA